MSLVRSRVPARSWSGERRGDPQIVLSLYKMVSRARFSSSRRTKRRRSARRRPRRSRRRSRNGWRSRKPQLRSQLGDGEKDSLDNVARKLFQGNDEGQRIVEKILNERRPEVVEYLRKLLGNLGKVQAGTASERLAHMTKLRVEDLFTAGMYGKKGGFGMKLPDPFGTRGPKPHRKAYMATKRFV